MNDWIAANYFVEKDGRILSLRTGRYLKGGMGTNGRPFVILWDGTKGHIKYIHKLVAETYLGPCPDGVVVSHRDDDPMNNNLENLVHETPKQNHARRKGNGIRDDGFHNSRAALKPGDPEEIRRLRSYGLTHQQIADEFGVSRVTISRVLNGLRYGGDVRDELQR